MENKPTTSNTTDEQACSSKYYSSANKSVGISPPMSYSAPYFRSSASLGTERGSMEPPLLHHHVGENGTANDNIPNQISCCIEDRSTLEATCRGTANNQQFVGPTAGVPSQMYVSKGSVRDPKAGS